MALDPVTSQSRSVALQLEPDSVVLAGDRLRLEVSPQATASARTFAGEEPVSSQSIALGLGAGDSRFFAGGTSEDFFDSQNLTIESGGNSLISGQALASSSASGSNVDQSSAQAVNLGYANVDFLDRYGGRFRIGSSNNPFSASSRVLSQKTLSNIPDSSVLSTLSSSSIVRGLEGKPLVSSTESASTEETSDSDDHIKLIPAQDSSNEQADDIAIGSGSQPHESDSTFSEGETLSASQINPDPVTPTNLSEYWQLLDLRDYPASKGFKISINSSTFSGWSTDFKRELGFYRVFDAFGAIKLSDGSLLHPGDDDYTQASLARENLFHGMGEIQLAPDSGPITVLIPGSEQLILAPYILDKTTQGEIIATHLPWNTHNPIQSIGLDLNYSVDPLSEQEQQLLVDRPSFLGQPDVNVEANSLLNLESSFSSFSADLSSDAVAIEGYEIFNVPAGNLDQTSSVVGSAVATAATDLNTTLTPEQSLLLSINADGIRDSVVYGAPSLDTSIDGFGLAMAESIPQGTDVVQARASGISSSIIATNLGDDTIRASAGMAIPILVFDTKPENLEKLDVAAFDESWLSSGGGDDHIHASILTEADVPFDLNSNGIVESDVYLDHKSTENSSLSGYSGFRNSFVHSGSGDDDVSGSSLGSLFITDLGDDNIDFDRVSESSIWSGIGDDVLSSSGTSLNSIFWGGVGDDKISLESGSGNILNGGLGQDHLTSGLGSDTFDYSDAAAAFMSSTTKDLSEKLADSSFWNNLDDVQKSSLWDTGRLTSSQGVELGATEVIHQFTTGEQGDVLALSSAMAGITQDLWESQGRIYEVDNNGLLSSADQSQQGSERIGFAVGRHEDLMKMGAGAPSFAYATDTQVLLYDADGLWDSGARTIGILRLNSSEGFSSSNIQFGSDSSRLSSS